MRRRVVEIVIIFLDVFALISLRTGESEQPFFQYLVLSVPERDRKTNVLLAVADRRDAILVPAERPHMGVFERKVIPRGTIGRIILANRSPRTFAYVTSPKLPIRLSRPRLFETSLFRFFCFTHYFLKDVIDPKSASRFICGQRKVWTFTALSAKFPLYLFTKYSI